MNHRGVSRYRKVNTQRPRTMALWPAEFIRRFLQQVSPSGFMKVRHVGFLSPSGSMSIEEVRARIELAQGFAVNAAPTSPGAPAPQAAPARTCPHCGGTFAGQPS